MLIAHILCRSQQVQSFETRRILQEAAKKKQSGHYLKAEAALWDALNLECSHIGLGKHLVCVSHVFHLEVYQRFHSDEASSKFSITSYNTRLIGPCFDFFFLC